MGNDGLYIRTIIPFTGRKLILSKNSNLCNFLQEICQYFLYMQDYHAKIVGFLCQTAPKSILILHKNQFFLKKLVFMQDFFEKIKNLVTK